MKFRNLLAAIYQTGTFNNQTVMFADKLVVRNQLSLICAFFSSFYLAYFLKNEYYNGAICIFISILLFITTICMNHYHWFNLSKITLVFATNFSVLFSSILFGYNSGFHLYLLTSPLITFMLFEPKQALYIYLSVLSYCLTFITILLLNKYNYFANYIIQGDAVENMYLINFIFTILVTITLLFYYSRNNLKVNALLSQKNETLFKQKEELKNEMGIRIKTEEHLVSLLADKNMLLEELNHRVKNNLAIISGLMELDKKQITDQGAAQLIDDIQGRIKAIALLHDQKYTSNNTGSINIKNYLDVLISTIKTINVQNKISVNFTLNIEPVEFEMDKALPLALIINELIGVSLRNSKINSNSLSVNIDLLKDNSTFKLNYTDLSNNNLLMINDDQVKISFANSLIHVLVLQINGKFNCDFSKGIRFNLIG